jgi:hypothetical protein
VFNDDATIRYNLACYECQLGRLDQARAWLERAFEKLVSIMFKIALYSTTFRDYAPQPGG